MEWQPCPYHSITVCIILGNCAIRGYKYYCFLLFMQAISYKFILIPLFQCLLYFNPNPMAATTTSFHDK